MDQFKIRLMVEDDLPGANALRQIVGWNQTPEDWVRMLRWEPGGCFVATLQEVVIGTVTTTTYGQTLAWIGMMLVHPDHRRQGIARGLMLRALQSLREKKVRCIRLDATPAGLPLYQQLGFVSEWTLTRHERPANSERLPNPQASASVRELSEADWCAVEAIDTRAFGAPRVHLLRRLAGDCRRAIVWPAEGLARGWGLLRRGANAEYLGPLECFDDQGAVPIVAALLRELRDRPAYWDVPDRNAAALATARDCGFSPVRPLTRMRLGPEIVATNPRSQFGIADPAVG